MKKLIYLFLALLMVACSDDEGNPCVYNPTLTTSAVTNITETSTTLNICYSSDKTIHVSSYAIGEFVR